MLGNNNIHILGISETKLNENHLTEYFEIQGYNTPFRKDRYENRGGGLLVYIKNNLNCIRRSDLEGNEIESIWVECKPKKANLFLSV